MATFHAGLNNGYYSYFEKYADEGKGAVIMTNSNNSQLIWCLIFTSLAKEYDWPGANECSINNSYTERQFEQVKNEESPRVTVKVDPSILVRYTGTYELASGFNFIVTLNEDQLHIKLGDQRILSLYPESKTKFFTKKVDAQLSFVLEEEGRVTALILHQNGRQSKAKGLNESFVTYVL